MPLQVELVNLNTEENPSVYPKVDYVKKAGRNTWYRRKIVQSTRGMWVLPALVQTEAIKSDLEEIAQAAFDLGREYQQAIQKGKVLPRC